MSERWLAYGRGYVARALEARIGPTLATSRRPTEGQIDATDGAGLAEALRSVEAVLVSAPPDDHGCPGLRALTPGLEGGARPRWIGYLSSTSVYGDLGGRWAYEASPLKGRSLQAARRTAAERDWLALGRRLGLAVCVFRLGAIYGPGRSALDRVGDTVIRKPAQVFSRAHVDDIASALEASLRRPRAGGVYNVADDRPSSAESVTACAAALLGLPAPRPIAFAEAELSEEGRRFWQECRRVSNARLKAELGWRPTYPSYVEGLDAIASTFKDGSGR